MLGKPQIKNFKVADNFAISVIREADSLIEENDKILKQLGNSEDSSFDDDESKNECMNEYKRLEKLVKASEDGFGGKYIFND